MLPAVTNLRVLSQSSTETTFGWDTVTDADKYAVTLDGAAYATVPQSATPSVAVTAPAGNHDLGVAPVANPTPPATLAFSVSGGGGGGGGGTGFLTDVVIIMEENLKASSIIGSSEAPYLNSLLPHGALAEPLNNCHPSQPNYIAVIGGSNYGCNADSPQPWPQVPSTAKSIVDLLEAANIPWFALMESLGTSLYAIKHDPFVQYPLIRNNPARMAKHIAYTDAFWSTWQGGYVFLSPNLTDDGHTAPSGTNKIKNLDNFLARVVPLIMASKPFTRAGSKAAINVSTDESEGSGGNGCVYPGYAPPFMSFWIGPGVKAGYRSTAVYQGHYSELATIEAGLGLPNLGQLDAKAPVMRDLFP